VARVYLAPVPQQNPLDGRTKSLLVGLRNCSSAGTNDGDNHRGGRECAWNSSERQFSVQKGHL